VLFFLSSIFEGDSGGLFSMMIGGSGRVGEGGIVIGSSPTVGFSQVHGGKLKISGDAGGEGVDIGGSGKLSGVDTSGIGDPGGEMAMIL
jgi:hypothetical protein